MSTKITLKYSNDKDTDFHLYLECCEGGAVYLSIGNPTDFFVTKNEFTIKIPEKIFEQIGSERLIEQIKNHTKSCEDF